MLYLTTINFDLIQFLSEVIKDTDEKYRKLLIILKTNIILEKKDVLGNRH